MLSCDDSQNKEWRKLTQLTLCIPLHCTITHQHDEYPRNMHRRQLVKIKMNLPIHRAGKRQYQSQQSRQHQKGGSNLDEYHEADEAECGDGPFEVVG